MSFHDTQLPGPVNARRRIALCMHDVRVSIGQLPISERGPVVQEILRRVTLWRQFESRLNPEPTIETPFETQ